jgi:hypothetical protein
MSGRGRRKGGRGRFQSRSNASSSQRSKNQENKKSPIKD